MLSGGNQSQPVLRRLNALRRLSPDSEAALDRAVRDRIQRAGTSEDLIREGDRSKSVRFILSGWAYRYKALEDGRRQIVSFLIAGDTCDSHAYLMAEMDHSIATLTPVTYAELERGRFEDLIGSDRNLAEAFLCETLVSSAMQRERVISLGRRDALERVAHVFCELYERLKVVDLVEGTSFSFPVTQMDLADATGLSVVHLNRTLQELRASGLITLRDRNLIIHDLEALANTALFSPAYLNLNVNAK